VDVTKNGATSGQRDVTVAANQKVSIDLTKSGAQTAKDKKNLAKLTSEPRYKGGWISDTIAVAGVTGNFSLAPTSISTAANPRLSPGRRRNGGRDHQRGLAPCQQAAASP